MSIICGYITEVSRDLRRCPSYYAADYEVIRTKSGKYPVYLSLNLDPNVWVIPMPELSTGVECERIEGQTFNGFGGVNFSSQELPKGPVSKHCWQPRLGTDHGIEFLPGFEWLQGSNYGEILTWVRENLSFSDARAILEQHKIKVEV